MKAPVLQGNLCPWLPPALQAPRLPPSKEEVPRVGLEEHHGPRRLQLWVPARCWIKWQQECLHAKGRALTGNAFPASRVNQGSLPGCGAGVSPHVSKTPFLDAFLSKMERAWGPEGAVPWPYGISPCHSSLHKYLHLTGNVCRKVKRERRKRIVHPLLKK